VNVLLIGGMGFIGSHVASRFVQEGYEVDIIDPQWNYLIHNQRCIDWLEENYAYRKRNLLQNVESLYHYAVTEYSPFPCKPYDYVVHLANFPLAGAAEKQPTKAIWYIDLLHRIIRASMPSTRFTYISSSMVYGNYEEDPIREDCQKEPVNVYGAVKLSQEMLVKLLCDRFSIPWTIVRPSAVYGPSDTNMRVIQKWLHQAFSNQPITVQSTNDMRMDFTYVTDTANGIFLATTVDAGARQIFNITRGEARSLWEVVDLIKVYFEDVRVVEKAGNQNRPRRGASDITKAQKMLQYRPWYRLEDGLEKYVEYIYNQNHSLVEDR